jgi:hypothetical protein
MAYMVPEIIPRGANSGERILFETLKAHLPSDYIVKHQTYISK